MTDEINYENVADGELFKWDKEGASLNGILISYRPQRDTGKGPGHVYEVKTKQGVAAFFAPSLLHKKLQAIPVGNIVSIVYTKMTKTANGNTLKNFEVKHAPATDANLKAIGLEILKKVETEAAADKKANDEFNNL